MTQLVNTIDSKEIYAARAVADKNGNDISTGYQKKLTAGTNITIDETTNTISASGGGMSTVHTADPIKGDGSEANPVTAETVEIEAGDNISIANGVISVTGKQDTLESGTNIKTINGESILGSGNLEIGGSGDETVLWEGDYSGTVTLSETPDNFERIALYLGDNTASRTALTRVEVTLNSVNSEFVTAFYLGMENFWQCNIHGVLSGNTITIDKIVNFKIGFSSGTSIMIDRSASLKNAIRKVVGINRKTA